METLELIAYVTLWSTKTCVEKKIRNDAYALCNRNMLFQASNAPVAWGKRVSTMMGASIAERFCFRPRLLCAQHSLLVFHRVFIRRSWSTSCILASDAKNTLSYTLIYNTWVQFYISQNLRRVKRFLREWTKRSTIRSSALACFTTNSTRWLHFDLGQPRRYPIRYLYNTGHSSLNNVRDYLKKASGDIF